MDLGDSMVVATVPVTDLDRARQFYGDTLGLRLIFESGPAIRWEAGAGSQLSTFRRGPSVADHTLAHFEVHDLDALIRDLEAKGVEFLDYDTEYIKTVNHVAQLGPARGAWMKDPDGNILGLRESPAPA